MTTQLVPAATNSQIVSRLNKEFVRAVGLPDVKDRLSTQGVESVGSTPQALAAHIKAEVARWDKVIKAAGIEPN